MSSAQAEAYSEANIPFTENQPKEPKPTENHSGPRFEEGDPTAHNLLDGKDERSIKNQLAAAAEQEKREKAEEEAKSHVLPTDAARAHGNEPSKGAKMDEKLMLEEEEEIRKKDEAKAQSKAAKHH